MVRTMTDAAIVAGEIVQCSCGNRRDTDGFEACLADGTACEPTTSSDWERHYRCARCETVIDVQSCVDTVVRRFVVAVRVPWNTTDDQFADIAELLELAVNDSPHELQAIWLER